MVLLSLLRLHGMCFVLNRSKSLARFVLAFVLVVGLLGECKHTHMLLCIQQSRALFSILYVVVSCTIDSVAGLWMCNAVVAAAVTTTSALVGLFGGFFA